MIPNFDAIYGDLSEIQADPRFMRLCTQQIAELSAITAKHAGQRVQLALAIKKESATVEPDTPCPSPNGKCTCTNGIGCVNVPYEEW